MYLGGEEESLSSKGGAIRLLGLSPACLNSFSLKYLLLFGASWCFSFIDAASLRQDLVCSRIIFINLSNNPERQNIRRLM